MKPSSLLKIKQRSPEMIWAKIPVGSSLLGVCAIVVVMALVVVCAVLVAVDVVGGAVLSFWPINSHHAEPRDSENSWRSVTAGAAPGGIMQVLQRARARQVHCPTDVA